MENVRYLRHVVGVDGMHVVVGAKTYRWDKRDISRDADGLSLRPIFSGVVGSWRPHDNQSKQATKVVGASPASCRVSFSLSPQKTAERTYQLLQAAVVDGVATGCPVIIERGIHLVDRDIVISADDATLYCMPGAIFRKVRTANALWFKGKHNRMLGNCEIDGAGYPGSGLIIDFSAQDTRIENVFSHHHGGHGVLNRGSRTNAAYLRTDNNGQIGFANDAAKGAIIHSILSRDNGNEGLTIDNPGVRSVRIVGGFLEGNCRKGGVGNIGVDAAKDIAIEGVILRNPHSPCQWNLTVQNDAGNTDRLTVLGGYFAGASAGDIHFRTNVNRGYVVRDSNVMDVISLSNGPAVAIDAGGERNGVSVKGYTGRILMDMQ